MAIDKTLPFSSDLLHEIAEKHGTPVFVYDEQGIRHNAQMVNKAYGWSKDYVNHFAVKATPTPGILRVIEQEGMGFDCSSRGELVGVRREGLGERGLFYSSNNTPDDDYRLAHSMGAVINIDKYRYFEQVCRAVGEVPAHMSIRYNPGDKKAGNGIIGNPKESKYGATEEQVLQALKDMRVLGVQRIGLHTMVASNEKNPEYFADTARLLRELAERAALDHGIDIDFMNVGGGIGVNYYADEEPVDVLAIGDATRSELESLEIPIVTEHGRYVTGPHGYLLTRVTHGIQETYEPYLQIDTSINNLARLATNSAAYHHINVLGKDDDPTRIMNVVGSMCANTDKMFKRRALPETTTSGDLLVIHDVGAHSRANSHNYNSLLRAGEVLVHGDGTHSLIRRHETLDDLFATTKGL